MASNPLRKNIGFYAAVGRAAIDDDPDLVDLVTFILVVEGSQFSRGSSLGWSAVIWVSPDQDFRQCARNFEALVPEILNEMRQQIAVCR